MSPVLNDVLLYHQLLKVWLISVQLYMLLFILYYVLSGFQIAKEVSFRNFWFLNVFPNKLATETDRPLLRRKADNTIISKLTAAHCNGLLLTSRWSSILCTTWHLLNHQLVLKYTKQHTILA